MKELSPVIISASRATDIPAFYSDWLLNRIQEGFILWKNPFNGVQFRVSFDKARLFVFWSKNPKHLIDKLGFFDAKNYNYYFQFTLNNYDGLGLENHLPSIDERIDTFVGLSNKIGKAKLIWRFDPLIISDNLSMDVLLDRVSYVGDRVCEYTNSLVFSFIDIENYKKVKKNVERINLREFDHKKMNEFAERIVELNKNWKLRLSTCSESIDLGKYNIEHNRCIDDRLIVELFNNDADLMDYIGYKKNENAPLSFLDPVDAKYLHGYDYRKIKDKGQRKNCGCIKSKDIGHYNTCPHGCIYCYANTNHKTAVTNFERNIKSYY